MQDRRISDMTFNPGSFKIIVIRPTPGLLTPGELKASLAGSPRQTEELLQSLKKAAWFQHIGTITCDINADNEHGVPFSLDECGGTLYVKDMAHFCQFRTANFLPLTKARRFNTYVSCAEHGCGFEAGSNLSLSEMRNVMFHLALKQMFPALTIANHVHCGLLTQQDHILGVTQLSRLQTLGTVAYHFDTLEGFFENSSWSHYSLGFVLTWTMNTSTGFDGFDSWARVLVAEKFKQLKDYAASSFAAMLGPKPALH